MSETFPSGSNRRMLGQRQMFTCTKSSAVATKGFLELTAPKLSANQKMQRIKLVLLRTAHRIGKEWTSLYWLIDLTKVAIYSVSMLFGSEREYGSCCYG